MLVDLELEVKKVMTITIVLLLCQVKYGTNYTYQAKHLKPASGS